MVIVLLSSRISHDPIAFDSSPSSDSSSGALCPNPPVADEITEDDFVGFWNDDYVVGDGYYLVQNFGEDHRYQIGLFYNPDDPDYAPGNTNWDTSTFNDLARDYCGAYGTWAYADGEMTITFTSAVTDDLLLESLDPPMLFTYEVTDFRYDTEQDWDGNNWYYRGTPDGDDWDFLLTAKFGSLQFWKLSDEQDWEILDEVIK
jgi:hypothetical protein